RAGTTTWPRARAPVRPCSADATRCRYGRRGERAWTCPRWRGAFPPRARWPPTITSCASGSRARRWSSSATAARSSRASRTRPRPYSFVGRDGSLLALRPDFTSLLAKIAAGRLAGRPAPMRLYYSGEVLRYEPPRAGRQSELYQMGLEHLGGDPGAADAEVLAIAAECLDVLGVSGFVLALGHVGVFGGLLAGTPLE